MSMPALSRHACAQAQRRGVGRDLIEALFTYGDVDGDVGGGCTVVRLSRDGLRKASVREAMGARADRLSSLALIIADDTGEVVTVMRDFGRRRGRRYRPWG